MKKCGVCNQRRPDEHISVISVPYSWKELKYDLINIKYCNDKEGCIAEAVKARLE